MICDRKYNYRIATYTLTNTSGWSATTIIAEFPQPSDLKANAISNSEIHLSWEDNCSFESGFIIERDDGNGFIEIARTKDDVTEFADTGLKYDTRYRYRVAAYTSKNKSRYTQEDSALAVGALLDYDGNQYKVVQIGEQIWMAENLKVTHFRDGSPIINVKDSSRAKLTTGSTYCIYNNNTSNEVDTYGALYNWHAVSDDRNIAPEGWHIPTYEDWKELYLALGGGGEETMDSRLAILDWGQASSKLWGSYKLWGLDSTYKEFFKNSFTALPGGKRVYSPEGTYVDYHMGGVAYFWSSTELIGSTMASSLTLIIGTGALLMPADDKSSALSVRCVRD